MWLAKRVHSNDSSGLKFAIVRTIPCGLCGGQKAEHRPRLSSSAKLHSTTLLTSYYLIWPKRETESPRLILWLGIIPSIWVRDCMVLPSRRELLGQSEKSSSSLWRPWRLRTFLNFCFYYLIAGYIWIWFFRCYRDVRIDTSLNKFVFSQGVKNVPTRIRVRLSRRRNEDEDAKEKV